MQNVALEPLGGIPVSVVTDVDDGVCKHTFITEKASDGDTLDTIIAAFKQYHDMPETAMVEVPVIEEVIANGPAVVLRGSGQRWVAKCKDDPYSLGMGIMVASAKAAGATYEDIREWEVALRMLSGLTSQQMVNVVAVLLVAAQAKGLVEDLECLR